MATVIEEFVGRLNWQVDTKGPKEFNRQKDGFIKGVAKIGAAFVATGAAIAAYVTHTNAQTAANYRLAKAFGVSFLWLDRVGDATKSVGLGAEGVTTGISFLQKQLGAVKFNPAAMGQLDKALGAIGLSYKEIAGSPIDKQFSLITDAIGGTADQATRFAVASRLFGRQGGAAFARLAALAESQGKTVSEYIGRYDDLEFESEQSAKGAYDYAQALGAITYALDEVKNAVAGYIGEALAPMLKDLRLWIASNRELIKSKIIEWARSLVNWLKGVYWIVSKLAGVFSGLVKGVGGVTNALKLAIAAWAGFKIASMTKGVVDLASSFKGLGKTLTSGASGGIVGILAAIAGVSIADLVQSLDDISNDSWGNEAARKLLATIDKVTLTLFSWKGYKFPDQASQDKFMAQWYAGQVKYIEDLQKKFAMLALNISMVGGRISDSVTKGIKAFAYWFDFMLDKVSKLLGKFPGFNTEGVSGYLRDALGSGLSNPIKSNPADYPEYGPALADVTTTQYKSPVYFNGNVNAPITINASPGMDETKVADQVNKHLEKTMKRAVRNIAQGE